MYKLLWVCTKIGLAALLAAVSFGRDALILPYRCLTEEMEPFPKEQLDSIIQTQVALQVSVSLMLALGSLLTNELAQLAKSGLTFSASQSADGARAASGFIALITAPALLIAFRQVVGMHQVSQLPAHNDDLSSGLLYGRDHYCALNSGWGAYTGAVAASGVFLCSLLLVWILGERETVQS